jgi:microcystin-dependent protein
MGNGQSDSSLPVGSALAFAGNETTLQQLDGWLPCDGRALNQQIFAALFAAIRYANGGNGSTSFNLPDYRGYFLRGVSYDSGRDPDANTRTAPASLGHSGNKPGSIQAFATGQPSTPFGLTISHLPTSSKTVNDGSLLHNPMAKWNSGSITVSFEGGARETRPRNKYVYFIIKSSTKTALGHEVAIPVGTVVPFAGANTSGLGDQWLLCNGSILDSTASQNQALFAAIGIIHGGNGKPNFYLPEYRGYFLRGVSGDTSNDPDAEQRLPAQPKLPPDQQGASRNNVGSLQYEDTAQAKNKFMVSVPHLPTSHMKVDPVSGNTNSRWSEVSQHLTGPNNGGGNESRPINAYVDWYIKAH